MTTIRIIPYDNKFFIEDVAKLLDIITSTSPNRFLYRIKFDKDYLGNELKNHYLKGLCFYKSTNFWEKPDLFIPLTNGFIIDPISEMYVRAQREKLIKIKLVLYEKILMLIPSSSCSVRVDKIGIDNTGETEEEKEHFTVIKINSYSGEHDAMIDELIAYNIIYTYKKKEK